MDARKAHTLALMERAVLDLFLAHRVEYQEYGRHLLLIAYDYYDEGEPREARRIIRRLEPRYLIQALTRQCVLDGDLARKVAELAAANFFEVGRA